MTVETEHFSFMDTVFKTAGHKPIGKPAGPETKVGVTSTTAVCKECGETWRAGLVGPGRINSAMGGVLIFTCQNCGQEEAVKFSAFL